MPAIYRQPAWCWSINCRQPWVTSAIHLCSGVMNNGMITWNIGDLNGYASSSLVLTATALAGGDHQNRATISSAFDANPANNTSSITVTILGADPYVSKIGPSILIGGQVVSYTLTYGNAGNQSANVTITDTLPIGFTAAEIVTDTQRPQPDRWCQHPIVDGDGRRFNVNRVHTGRDGTHLNCQRHPHHQHD